MVKQVVAFGDPVLKAEAQAIEKGHKDLETLINDMWETMYSAEGVGIAAPQVGESIRLFVVDGTPFGEDDEVCHGFKRVMINPVIFESSSDHSLMKRDVCPFLESERVSLGQTKLQLNISMKIGN